MTLTFVKKWLPTTRSICLTTLPSIKYGIEEGLINLSGIMPRLILDAKDYLIDRLLNPDSQQISSHPNERVAYKNTSRSLCRQKGPIGLLDDSTRGSKECTLQPYSLLGLLNLQETGKECLE